MIRNIQQLDLGKCRRQRKTSENLEAIWETRGAKSEPQVSQIPITTAQTEAQITCRHFFDTRCRNQATKLRFRDKAESNKWLLEQLIVGTKHKKVEERLLEKGEQLTFDIAKIYEAIPSQMEQLEGENNKDIHGSKGNENDNDKKAKKCLNCGLEHPSQPRSKCPAYGYLCLNYQKENHWTIVCRSRTQKGARGRQRNRENSRSRHSRSKDRHTSRRFTSRKRRDGDER